MASGPYKTERQGYGPTFDNAKFGGNSPGKGSSNLKSGDPKPGKTVKMSGFRSLPNAPGSGLRITSSNMKK